MRKVKKMESNAYSLSSFEEMMISLYLDSTDSHLVKDPELTLVRMWVRPGKLEGMFKVGKVSTVSGEILEFESKGEMESFRGVQAGKSEKFGISTHTLPCKKIKNFFLIVIYNNYI